MARTIQSTRDLSDGGKPPMKMKPDTPQEGFDATASRPEFEDDADLSYSNAYRDAPPRWLLFGEVESSEESDPPSSQPDDKSVALDSLEELIDRQSHVEGSAKETVLAEKRSSRGIGTTSESEGDKYLPMYSSATVQPNRQDDAKEQVQPNDAQDTPTSITSFPVLIGLIKDLPGPNNRDLFTTANTNNVHLDTILLPTSAPSLATLRSVLLPTLQNRAFPRAQGIDIAFATGLISGKLRVLHEIDEENVEAVVKLIEQKADYGEFGELGLLCAPLYEVKKGMLRRWVEKLSGSNGDGAGKGTGAKKRKVE